MENAFTIALASAFLSMRWQIVMFLVDIIVLGLVSEFIKATLFPKKIVVEGEKQKECPRWLGLIFGLIVTMIHITCSYAAFNSFGSDGWYIPGEAIFIWAWFILFFFIQFKALKIVKYLRDKLFPGLKDPSWTKQAKPKKEKERVYSKEEVDAIIAQFASQSTK